MAQIRDYHLQYLLSFTLTILTFGGLPTNADVAVNNY